MYIEHAFVKSVYLWMLMQFRARLHCVIAVVIYLLLVRETDVNMSAIVATDTLQLRLTQ